MTMYWRWVTVGAAVLMLLGVSCSALAAQQPVTLSLTLTGSPEYKIKPWIDKFNAEHPHIQVEISQAVSRSSMPTYTEQLLTYIAADTYPDMMIGAGGWAIAFGGPTGPFLDLRRYVEGPNGVVKKRYLQDWWYISTIEGGIYQAFFGFNDRALYINTDLAEEAGMNTAKGPDNWDELLVWARRLTVDKNGDGITDVWGFDNSGFWGGGGDYWVWTWLNDGAVFNQESIELKPDLRFVFDQPNSVEALEYLVQCVNDYQVSPKGWLGQKGSFAGLTLGMQMSTQGLGLSLMQSRPDLRFMTVKPPHGVGKVGGRFAGAGSSLVAFKTTKHPDEVWEFIKWFAFENGGGLATDLGMLPTDIQAWQTQPFWRDKHWQAFFDAATAYPPKYVNRRGFSADIWLADLKPAVQAALKGERPARLALEEANRALNNRLAEELARQGIK